MNHYGRGMDHFYACCVKSDMSLAYFVLNCVVFEELYSTYEETKHLKGLSSMEGLQCCKFPCEANICQLFSQFCFSFWKLKMSYLQTYFKLQPQKDCQFTSMILRLCQHLFFEFL